MSIDQGTSSTRVIIYDKLGKPVSVSQQEHKQYYPHPAWVEHDANEIKNSVLLTMKTAVQSSKIDWKNVKAIGITNQRETTVVWDKVTGLPLHNAIVWQCRRTSERISELVNEGYTELFRDKTGLVLDAYFSGSKLEWLLQNIEKVRSTLKNNNLAFGTIDSWITYFLTNKHVTDASNASRTLLYNINLNQWDSELCEILNIPFDILPEVKENASSNPFGYYKIDGHEIPINGILGDQQAALFGQGGFQEKDIKTTYGTGNFILLNTGEKKINTTSGLLSTVGWQLNNKTTYCLEGSVFSTGGAIQWLRDNLNIINDYAEIDGLASQSQDSDGVIFVPALSGLGAPHWDSNARGLIIGLTQKTSKSNLMHATLDSIALQTQDLIKLINKETGYQLSNMKVDGGITNSNILMQKQADYSQIEIQKPVNIETTALGAAMMAGYNLIWDSFEELSHLNKLEISYKPRRNSIDIKEQIKYWSKAIERTKNWLD